MGLIARDEILARMRRKIDNGEPIIGGGAGTGLSAKCEEDGGIDVIVLYNSGRYRMAGRGSLAGLLAFGNANEIVLEMAREIMPVVRDTPVLAGVNATDPFIELPGFLERCVSAGFSGVQNFPTVGLIDGVFRANLEETDMGYRHEVELVRIAHEAGLFTTPYVFSSADAEAMVKAGADVIVCHMGLTTGGKVGAHTARTLDDCVRDISAWAGAARQVREDVIVLCHGGPIAEPRDALYVLDRVPLIDGFYGASSLERLPVEEALSARVREFVSLRRTGEGSWIARRDQGVRSERATVVNGRPA
jgi:predicted TIM-barrel enzyme